MHGALLIQTEDLLWTIIVDHLTQNEVHRFSAETAVLDLVTEVDKYHSLIYLGGRKATRLAEFLQITKELLESISCCYGGKLVCD